MKNPDELFEEIESMLDGLGDRIDECKRVQDENFNRLEQELDPEQVTRGFNTSRAQLLAKLKASLEKRFDELVQLNSSNPTESEMKAFSDKMHSEVAFTPTSSDTESINLGSFVDLVYKNPFSIQQKVDYVGLYSSTESSIEVTHLKMRTQQSILMPISRNRILFYDNFWETLNIVDSKLRVLSKKDVPRGREYKNIKVYGQRIVATGTPITSSDDPFRPKLDIVIDVYDLSLRLTATRRFDLARTHLGHHIKLERVSKDIFMHRYSADEEVYTLFDFELNKIVEHRTPLQKFHGCAAKNRQTKFEPFFYDGEKVKPLTAWHLYLLIHNPNEMAERKKRLLNLYTSQQIEWEHLQEANKIDAKYFDYKEKPQIFLVFNLDRDTFTYLQALNDPNLRSVVDSYNWITVDEKHKGGITANGDFFSAQNENIFSFI